MLYYTVIVIQDFREKAMLNVQLNS